MPAWGCSRSSCSSAWTGSRRCRPRLLCREVFGKEKVGVVFAWVFSAHQFGAAFAAWGAGASRTWWGSYEPAFLAAGALGVIAAALSLSVGRRGVLRVQPARA